MRWSSPVLAATAALAVVILTACGGSISTPRPDYGDSPSTPTRVVGGTPFTLPDGTRCVRFDGGGGDQHPDPHVVIEVEA